MMLRPVETLRKILESAGDADIIIPYQRASSDAFTSTPEFLGYIPSS